MPKKLLSLMLTALLVFMPITKVNAYKLVDDGDSGQIISGVLLDGKVSYIAEEIKGAELDTFLDKISARPDVAPLLLLAQQKGYSRQQATAFDITLFNEQSGQKILESRALDISFTTHNPKKEAHLKVYDFSDHTLAALVSYMEKPNGHQIIDIYQVADGNAALTQTIDSEKVAIQCAEGKTASPDNSSKIQPASTSSCSACLFACGVFAASGCAIGALL
jgi:hypothetical protein